jgi:predicted nucleic acid-binding Zn ribbon protein
MAVTMAVTIPARSCPICGAPFTPAGRRRYCSAACRQRAYLWRRAQAQSAPAPLARPSGAASVYECPACPACGSRYLDEQRCPECNLFCRRIGLGGPCPHCDEPVAAADLLDPAR